MSDLDGIVDVTVSTEATGIASTSFGTQLVMSYHTRFNDLYRIYSGPGEMADDGFTSYDEAYRAVAIASSQEPRPENFVVGRHTVAPSFSMRLEVLSATENDVISGKYLVPQSGQEVTFTRTVPSSSSLAAEATALALLLNDVDVDSIIASGFASTAGTQTLTGASLNGVVGGTAMSPGKRLTFTFSSHADWDASNITVVGTDKDGTVINEVFAIPNGGGATVTGTKVFRSVTSVALTAQSGTGGTATMGTIADIVATVASSVYVDVTPRTAGRPVHLHELTKLGIEDNTADASYATSLTNLQAVYDDWYFVSIDSMSPANVAAVAAWVEASASKKLFFFQTNSTLEKAGGAAAPSNALKVYKRTIPCAYIETANYGQFSTMAYAAASFPGSYTLKFKNLPGVSAGRVTSTVATAYEGNNVNYYATVHGRNIMQQGKTSFGEYVDIIHGIDALISALQEATFGVMSSLPKVPINKRGLLLIKTAMDAAAQDFFDTETRPGLITDGTWNVLMPALSAISDANKAARRVPGILFSGGLAGAIHFLSIRGNLTAT